MTKIFFGLKQCLHYLPQSSVDLRPSMVAEHLSLY